ncbi:hypothetical protein BST14_27365 [Mycobacterium arosiense ATCC BAA-1401 = DSM 45069]|uniref:Uncharacterized protein n=1 Tax=Mycobacterium arosiense ATCC BAA-1401 = DSM 45069 TaxID=1265311 RepID=A0A1W9Z5B4_MYCAI|nr:hypothetical protein BST14_27365 [Mycobacterium arosiense ATCC BAA-1401 = DSM 45069]
MFMAKYGTLMGHDSVWLQRRRNEIDSPNRILLSINDVTDRAIRGPGADEEFAWSSRQMPHGRPIPLEDQSVDASLDSSANLTVHPNPCR